MNEEKEKGLDGRTVTEEDGEEKDRECSLKRSRSMRTRTKLTCRRPPTK